MQPSPAGSVARQTGALAPSLAQILGQESRRPLSPALLALGAAIKERFGGSLLAILLYGSVLRGGREEDNLSDFLVVVDNFKHAYRNRKLRFLNSLLPPNAFYLEASLENRILRSKYTVVSLSQLWRYTASTCLQTYFWGRLAQPVALVHVSDETLQRQIPEILAQAFKTFIKKAAPLLPPSFTARELWKTGLEASYGTEFRPEREGVGGRLFDHDRQRYERLTGQAARELRWPPPAAQASGELVFEPPLSGAARWRARWAWRGRRLQGRFLHILRLLKGLSTFEGGVDYLLWKIERHAGVHLEVSERARRHPLLAGLRILFQLRKRGDLR